MKDTIKKVTVSMMIAALLSGGLAVPSQDVQAASKKVSITRKAKVTVGKTVKVKLKNNKKKVTWKITKGKKLITITKKSKTYAKVRGIKKGTARVQAVVGKKKYTCTVTVSAAKKKTIATSQPQADKTPVPTSGSSGGTPAPTGSPDDTQKIRTIVYDGTNIEEIKNTRDLVAVVVKEGMASIKDRIFEGCTRLRSITIPDGVVSIGERAFRNCSALKNVTIPNSVTSIGASAFAGCGSLESIEIPNGVTWIRRETFLGCGSLKSIKLPDDLLRIDTDAFETEAAPLNGLTSIEWKGTIYYSLDVFLKAFDNYNNSR